jgi:replication-associated recombination protein RarA
MLVEDTQQQCLVPLTLANQGKILAVIPKTSKSNQKQTQREYDFYELLSALQKDIRRGNEYLAMFWAVELESLNAEALWNRLIVIACEDIGPANPLMPLLIETLKKQYFDAREKEDDSYRLFLSNAIISLARSRKSRIVDDLLNVVYGEIQHEGRKPAIPDYAFDIHTREGRNMGRGFEHFFSEGAKLNNEAFKNPYTERAKEILTKYGKLKPDARKETAQTGQQTTLPMP